MPEIVIGTHTTDFVYLTASSTESNATQLEKLHIGSHQIELELEYYSLKSGVYGIRMAIFDQYGNNLYSGENLLFFTVNDSIGVSKEPPLRLLSIPSKWLIGKTTRDPTR